MKNTFPRQFYLRLKILLIIGLSFISALTVAAPAGRYVKVTLDDLQQLVVTTNDKHTFKPKKYTDQVGFRSPQISADGNTVGWLTLYDNCCTSYAIPLELVIFRKGKTLQRFTGNGTPVWNWYFVPGTENVAFSQQPTHGSNSSHYELRNIETGVLVAEYYGNDDELDGEETNNSNEKKAAAPDWVTGFPKNE